MSCPGNQGAGGLARPATGFVYATTGADYTTLARRAARSLRLVMPDARVDLFTDQNIDDPVFDRIHRLSDSWFRPRMEAMRRTRFDRTAFLDADTIVLADVSELFALLDRYEFVGCQAMAQPMNLHHSQPWIPHSFPYLNGGMLVARKSSRIRSLATDWERTLRRHGLVRDQATLRALLHDRHIRFQVVPPEYNLIQLERLDHWLPNVRAPRILHVTALHRRPSGDPMLPFDLTEALGPARADRVRDLIEAERRWRPDPTAPPIAAPIAEPAPALRHRLRTAALRLSRRMP